MNLVPTPKTITPKAGAVSLAGGWKLDAPKELARLACLEDLAFVKPEGAGTLVLRIDENVSSDPLSPHLSRTDVRERGERVRVRGGSDERYRLDLAPKRIELSAATTTGIIRGVQTLRQLAHEGECDACVIEDAPTLAIRGFHIDFRPKSYRLDTLLETIGRLAELKYNCLLIEWENKFPFKSHPEIVHPEALTWDDIKQLKAACAKYAIEIIPLVQTLGHLEHALHIDAHADLREVPDDVAEICPLKDDAVRFVTDLVRDIVDGHPESRFVHVGSDEAYVMGTCPACKANCEEIGRSAHFINHMKKVAQVVIDAGKKPIMWNDMLIHHPEAIALLPKEMVMLDWHYHTFGVWCDEIDAGWHPDGVIRADNWEKVPEPRRTEFGPYYVGRHPSDPKKLRSFPYTKYFMDKGFDVIAGPSSCCHQDPGTNPNISTRVPNCWGFAASAALDGALGCILTSWEVRRHPWQVQWYPIAVCAETSWHPFEGIREDFDARFMRSQYGVSDTTVPQSFDALDRMAWEDRCDHYGEWNNAERMWSSLTVAEDLAKKDERGDLRDKAPQTKKSAALITKAEAARDVFRRFVDACERNDLDARFWELAATETIFRVELFDVLKRTYLSRKAGDAPDDALKTDVSRIIEKGDALYDVARGLWEKLLPPKTLNEEIFIRWDRPREYLTANE